jgi:hypothetical protein
MSYYSHLLNSSTPPNIFHYHKHPNCTLPLLLYQQQKHNVLLLASIFHPLKLNHTIHSVFTAHYRQQTLWWWWWCQWGETMSLNCSHQQAYPSYTRHLLSDACHIPCPPHSPWLDLLNDISGWVQIMKFLIVQLPPFSCYFIPLRSKYSPQNLVLSICSSISVRNVSYPYNISGKSMGSDKVSV